MRLLCRIRALDAPGNRHMKIRNFLRTRVTLVKNGLGEIGFEPMTNQYLRHSKNLKNSKKSEKSVCKL